MKRDDVIYLAGLFDGEGCVTYKKYWDCKRKDKPRKYLCWRIALEIVMTDKPTIDHDTSDVHEPPFVVTIE